MSDHGKAVFLSYASQDADAARRICEALRQAGVEVWFDQNELTGGDAWDAKIRGQIKACALFVPVISANTNARREGYFRREWKLAVDRTHDMDEALPFLLPLVIDGTSDAGAFVPEKFREVQWTRLPRGETPAAFCARVKTLLEGGVVFAGSNVDASLDGARGRGRATPPLRKSSRRWLLPAVIALAAIIALAVWRPWRAKETSPPTSAANAPAPVQTEAERPVTKASEQAKGSLTANEANTTTPAKRDEKSIAVLAFENKSDDLANELFSDGLSEDLIGALGRVPGLTVTGWTSSLFLKKKNLPTAEIGRQLGVAYVVRGSVWRTGNTGMRITAQVSRAANDVLVWSSEPLEREVKDGFKVRDEIAGLIAQALSLKLGVASPASKAEVNPEAYRLYLEGRQAWNLRNEAEYAQAEGLFERALALDPKFARAHAGLADVWTSRGESANDRFDQSGAPVWKKIDAAIQRALELDPGLAEARASLGSLRRHEWKIDESIRELRLAVALNPNYASAHQWLGRSLMFNGQMDEALAALRRAHELEPLSSRIADNYSLALNAAQRFAEGLAMAERALALQPDSKQALRIKVVALAGLGRNDETLVAAQKYIAAGLEEDPLFVSYALARIGARREAEQVLAMVGTEQREPGKSATLLALGKQDEVLASLRADSMSVRTGEMLHFWPVFDPIRSDLRFVKMLATLGLTEAHARAQTWRAKNQTN